MKGIMSLLPLRTRHLMMRAALLTLALLLSACGGGLSKDDSDEAFAVNAGRDRAAADGFGRCAAEVRCLNKFPLWF